MTALVAWALITGWAFNWLRAYEGTPGEQRPAPTLSPERGEGYTLRLFLHPKCPCSRATLRELARLAARADGRLAVYVHFILPGGADNGWEGTSLHEAAAAIPGVTVVADVGGAAARRYGAATSGQAVLYGPGGRLEFAGGITASRGHEGDNDGVAAILEIIGRRQPATVCTQVFGCALFNDDDDNDNWDDAPGPAWGGKATDQ